MSAQVTTLGSTNKLRDLVRKVPRTRWFRVLAFAILGLVLIFYGAQGIRSAFRLYPSGLQGFMVQAVDATPVWTGTRALLFEGVIPYSPEGKARIQTAYFGRPLGPEDDAVIHDRQNFAFPLFIIWLYTPTILFDFSIALVLLWIVGLLAVAASIWIWFELASFPMSVSGRTLLASAFLLMPQVYIALQTRQPALWVLFFTSASVFLLWRMTPASDWLAGFVLALATIKPQSSALVLGYLVLVYALLHRGLRNSIGFYLGLVLTGLGLWLATEILVPGWIGYWVETVREYSQYASSTGADELFAAQSPGWWGVTIGFILVWVGMVWFMVRHPHLERGHLWALAYAMCLQIFIFPSHTYNYVFGIPIMVLGAQEIWRQLSIGWSPIGVLMIALLCAALYFSFYAWTGILAEGGAESLGLLLRTWLPGRVVYYPVVVLLLGAVGFYQAVFKVTSAPINAPAH